SCVWERWTGAVVAPRGGGVVRLLGSVVAGLLYGALARRGIPSAPEGPAGPAPADPAPATSA
ncbi:cytosine or purine or uracil or thiamine or allantoin permease, partial [Streptomyces sp. NPDC055060]